MIQEIQPETLSNEYGARAPRKESRLMAFRDNQIYVKKEEHADYLTYGELAAWCKRAGEALPETVYLFSIGTEDYFLTDLPGAFEREQEQRYEYAGMFSMRGRSPKKKVFAAATAWHLYVWYRDNRYCGRCGGKLAHDGKQRMLACPVCKNLVFPKIAPAVIVGVTDKDRILMTKYAGREYKRYALIAGFTEIGETAEETVRREVKEEVGLNVKNIRYYKSQPWGFDSNLLLGYFCELDDTDRIKLDEEELSEAEWVKRCDIPDFKEDLSLTHEMMTVFREAKE